MSDSQQIALLVRVSKSQGIDTHNPNWRIAYTDSGSTIVTVGQKDELLHLVTRHNLARVTVQLGKNPDLLTITQRTASMQAALASIDERLEPFKSILVLERDISRPNNPQNTIIVLAIGSPCRNIITVFGYKILGSNFPIQPTGLNGLADCRSRFQLLTKTVPRSSTSVKHRFNISRHFIVLSFVVTCYALSILYRSSMSSEIFRKILDKT